ncbi:MAG: glutathione S-transferase [Candidatus Azotimanducaceae bacterium]|jgi:glutathione S-transferase
MLKIYGVPNSQPVRAVVWVCLMKGLPFEFVMTSQNKAAKTPEYLKTVNPRGTIPSMDDDGLLLWESHAILVYLCEKYGWTDLWPEDLGLRAKVNQYLHFHHRNTREVVIGWSRALWPSVFGVKDPDAAWLKRNTFAGLANNAKVVQDTLQIVEGMLIESPFLVGECATLADISAYEELGQNQAKYANCTDYTSYPSIQRWFVRMGALPEHDRAHRIWQLIGDVGKVSGGMAVIASANKAAAKEWLPS